MTGGRREEAERGAAERGAPAPAGGSDRVLVYGLSDSGRTAHVVREREGAVELGRLQPVESGKALAGDLVTLRQRPEFPLLFDVDVQVESPLQPRARTDRRAGPARVTNAAWRRGWDAIWGRGHHADDEDDAGGLPQ